MEFNNNDLQPINLTVLLDDFLKEAKRLWIFALVLVALCAAGFTAFRYLTFTPYYEASASFTIKVVNPLHANVSGYNTATAEQMEKTFPYILNSDALRNNVMKYLGIEYVPGVSASALGGSNIFTLTVKDRDPNRAYQILQAVIVCYPDVADFVVGPTRMILLDESGVPTTPYNAFSLRSSLQKGAIIGAALWCLIVFLMALTKSTIHNEVELRRVLNVDCLGELPTGRVMRKNICPLVIKGVDRTGFGESVRLLRLRVEKELEEKQRKVILISSAIPGEGKTTVSVNLAISMALKGKKVLIIDCDMRNPTVGKALQIKNTAGMAEYLTTNASVRDIISGTKIENLSVITGGTNVKAGYAELLSDKRLGQLVKAASTLFDYVILDTPPCSLLADAAEVGSVADTALIVIRHDFASQEQIMDGVRGLSDCGVPIMGCVLNGIEHGFSTGYGYGYGYGHGYGYGYSYRHSYGYGNNGK